MPRVAEKVTMSAVEFDGPRRYLLARSGFSSFKLDIHGTCRAHRKQTRPTAYVQRLMEQPEMKTVGHIYCNIDTEYIDPIEKKTHWIHTQPRLSLLLPVVFDLTSRAHQLTGNLFMWRLMQMPTPPTRSIMPSADPER